MLKKIKEYNEYTVKSNVKCNAYASDISLEKVKFDFKWTKQENNGIIVISYEVPCTGFECVWEPTCLMNRNLNLNFTTTAMGAVPLVAYCTKNGNSSFAIALSDTINKIDYKFAVVEETAMLNIEISVSLSQFGEDTEYSLTLYTQRNEKPLYEICANVRAWWKEIYKINQQNIADEVYTTCYSTWYAFHQNLTDYELLNECRKAKEYGMDMVIIDDGWQTEDASRGYAYCGDWKPCNLKIADMKKFVYDIHMLGMKFVLWYSVPFVGYKSDLWNKYKDKILGKNEEAQTGILDPRYPEVREYIVGIYVKAITDWDIDGFKLDFIDSFRINSDAEYKKGMDYYSVQKAVEKLISDISLHLRKIKENVIIEFRQGYVGPNMAVYSSMFRAVDCPLFYRQNRVATVDLRLLNDSTAVHSDMLMWNKNHSPQIAALQILNVIFSVIQFSVRFDDMSRGQKEMIKFWLKFAKENRKLLVKSQIKPEEVQNFYPIVRVENDEECIIAVYEQNKVIDVDAKKKNMIINASGTSKVIINTTKEIKFKLETFDCMGNKITSNTAEFTNGLGIFSVPESGLLVLENKETN